MQGVRTLAAKASLRRVPYRLQSRWLCGSAQSQSELDPRHAMEDQFDGNQCAHNPKS